MTSTLRNKKVTIIIPVYKDWVSLNKCLISCDKYIEDIHEVLVINDASPEVGLEENIKNFIQGKLKFKYHKNQENLGFVKTCNKGVETALEGNDILLLNSDTEVTEGFLDEMIACLYESERHGVCCPRSNNATIFSLPLFYSASVSPKDDPSISFSAWQKIKDLMPRFHVVPTGIGFCMLIKRQLVINFGLFDEIYLVGYNEENDFCARINRYGYSVVAANRAFVYHLETKSFTKKQKILLEKRNRKILDDRYPEYETAVSYYLNWDTPVAERFADLMGQCYPKKKVLFDLSRLACSRNGTTEHALALLEALYPQASERYDFYIAINAQANKYFDISERFSNVIVVHDHQLPLRFDLIYVPYQIFEYEYLFMINRFGLRYVIDILDLISVRSNYLRNKDLKPIFRTAMEYANGLLVNTDTVWSDVQNFFQFKLRPHQRVATMHISKEKHVDYGVPMSEEEDGIIDNLPKDYVLLVGNAYHHKSLAVTLEKLKENYQVVVLGTLSVQESFVPRGNITFIKSGELSDVFIDTLYKKSRCILYPSQYEGFGLPILSAILYDKPIILFNSATNREVTAAYTHYNSLFFFEYFHQIDEIVKKVMKQNTSQLVHKKIINLERTWDVVATETLDFIDNVLNVPIDVGFLQKRSDLINQLELIYKYPALSHTNTYKTRSVQFLRDIPRALRFIREEGVIQGVRRLFWYIQGVRMIPKK